MKKIILISIISLLRVTTFAEARVDLDKCGYTDDGVYRCSEKKLRTDPAYFNTINPVLTLANVLSAAIIKTQYKVKNGNVNQDKIFDEKNDIDTLFNVELEFCGPNKNISEADAEWKKLAEGNYTEMNAYLGGVLATIKEIPFSFTYNSRQDVEKSSSKNCYENKKIVYLKCTILQNKQGAQCIFNLGLGQKISLETFRSGATTSVVINE